MNDLSVRSDDYPYMDAHGEMARIIKAFRIANTVGEMAAMLPGIGKQEMLRVCHICNMAIDRRRQAEAQRML